MIIADGGTVGVVRALASHAFGAYTETRSDQNQVQSETKLGYVAQLRGEPQGGFGFGLRFVRRDVKISQPDSTSDVEAVLDDVAQTTKGDVLVDREVGLEGLGAWVPGIDFTVGDVVPVMIAGRRVSLPVSTVEAFTDGAEFLGWRVQVGGQPTRDSKKHARDFAEIKARLDREQRERVGQNAQLSTRVSAASSLAYSAETRADGADRKAIAADVKAQSALERAVAANSKAILVEQAVNRHQTALVSAMGIYQSAQTPFTVTLGEHANPKVASARGVEVRIDSGNCTIRVNQAAYSVGFVRMDVNATFRMWALSPYTTHENYQITHVGGSVTKEAPAAQWVIEAQVICSPVYDFNQIYQSELRKP